MRQDEKHIALLAFGANLPSPVGAPAETLRAAAAALGEAGLHMQAVSPLYRTTAITLPGSGPVPDFINAAALAETDMTPPELLDLFQATERRFGRTAGARWSARPLDIDLLAWDNAVLPSAKVWHDLAASPDPAAILPEPVVPHPRLHGRGFVLAPLRDVAATWRHPVLGKTVTQLYDAAAASGGLADVTKITAG